MALSIALWQWEALQARLLHHMNIEPNSEFHAFQSATPLSLNHQPNTTTTTSNQHSLRFQPPQTSTMPSIGPQLPPHLQKRKRTPADDDTSQTAPPPKATRRANDDEIALDSDSSSDGYGPSAPNAPSKSKPTIGPSLPPSATTRPSQPIGPSMPPPSASNKPDSGNTPPRRILGPAPPPAPLSQRPPRSPSPPRNSNSDSDSDDDYGPALPSTNPASTTTAHPSRRPPSPPPAAPKRDDWMLAPPSAPSSRTAPDPTKLKSRKFASSSKAPSSGSGSGSGISSIWTETPEEKARRLANAVLGREDPSTNPAAGAVTAGGGGGKGGMVSFRRTAADEEKIRAYAEQTRGRSLVEEFAEAKKEGKREKEGGGGKKKDEDDDDPSKRAFDWEKDMKVGGQISNSQRQQLLNRAANFGGRFQKGSFL